MYSRDSYLEMFVELNNILKEGITKDPNNKVVKNMININDRMFFYTNQLFNKQDSIDMENRLLYQKLHETQVELETLKMKCNKT
tara:strand:- start:4838 stop:5089 length:252 start_codon:yes stop_codon:yes gene_type:complete